MLFCIVLCAQSNQSVAVSHLQSPSSLCMGQHSMAERFKSLTRNPSPLGTPFTPSAQLSCLLVFLTLTISVYSMALKSPLMGVFIRNVFVFLNAPTGCRIVILTPSGCKSRSLHLFSFLYSFFLCNFANLKFITRKR